MAAALFADTAKVAFQPLPIQGRFSFLLGKEVDLLVRNTSRTIGREAQLGVLFAGPLFITAQTFPVRTELEGKDLAAQLGLRFQPMILDNDVKAREAFTTGHSALLSPRMRPCRRQAV